ncbi:TPA: hypothetical protein ACH3X1_015490 [Trebouxia sp. C0004]
MSDGRTTPLAGNYTGSMTSSEAGTTTRSAGVDTLISPTSEQYEKNMQGLVGSLFDPSEEEDIPLLYFHSFMSFFKWVCSWAIPGLGMFSEAYFVFSIGNIKPILADQYPACWSKYQVCSKTITQIPDYIQIVGIILGMCTLGYLGDKIGRKWGSVFTASIMLVGAILLTAVDAPSEKGFVIMYIVAQFTFGYGVGGEYPMAAGSAAERAEAKGRASARKRGREVVMTFSMQGVGNFTNTAVLCILLTIYSSTEANKRTHKYTGWRLGGVWRTAYGIGMIPILYMLYYRIFRLRESAVWKKRKSGESRNMGLLMKHYWPRLMATCGCWFLWDFSFYGNKVFQSAFIKILSPAGADLEETLLWTLLNSGVALIGYWLAASVIDNPKVGRLRLQLLGFAAVCILFYLAAAIYPSLASKKGLPTFQFIYFFSSFWGQFGPNCTTFLLAGELYPTEVRTTAHGMSAGVAKVGALWATIWFNYSPLTVARNKFWATSTFNVAGFLLTLVFLPDPMRISLAETDRRWRYILAGRTYHGEAINPKSLSLFERYALRLHKNYDRKLDAEESLEDLRELGLEVKDARTGNYLAPGSGGVQPVSDSARGANVNGKEGAAGFTNGFGNPATIGKPLAGQVAHV